MPLDTALIEALLAPVPGDAPAGRDLRYDPRYDRVKDARREDPELPPGGLATERKLADWALVASLGRELLVAETKDLQLAAWLAEALLHRGGIGGLATGLDALQQLVDRYWDGCFPAWDPEDPELRSGALEWVGTKLEIPVRQAPLASDGTSLLDHAISRSMPTQAEADGDSDRRKAREAAIKDGKVTPEAVDLSIEATPKAWYRTLVADLEAAQAALLALDRTCDARFGRDAPGFGRLRGALDDFQVVAGAILAQKLIDDPDPIVEVTADGDVPSAGATPESGLAAEPVNAADATARVVAGARFLRQQDPTRPAPYLVLRGLRWSELRGGALGDGPDPRLLEAPPTAVRARLRGLLLDGKWPELLEQGEGVMATGQGRGWLDLQRYALTACERLGPTYEPVATAIRGALRALLVALPRLPEMMLMDDTPTANPETQAWLASEGLLPAADVPAAPAVDDVDDGAPDTAIGDQADTLAAAIAEERALGAHGGLAADARVARRNGRAATNGAHGAGPARDAFVAAQGELAQGRPNRAVELLLDAFARERSERGRFVRQVQVAWVMVESGMEAVAGSSRRRPPCPARCHRWPPTSPPRPAPRPSPCPASGAASATPSSTR